MESIRFLNTCVVWTRSTALILSILIVILSLSVYNYNAIPVLLLLENELETTINVHQIIYDMVQDRRLIAALVAAQASIFCPLFLLMSTSTSVVNLKPKVPTCEVWRTVVEQFCQFLMPLGLALSWLFCITFDRRTNDSLASQKVLQDDNQDHYCQLANYIGDSLKYIIIVVLLLEVVIIWISSFKYASVLSQQVIMLEEGEDYTQLGYEDEEEQISFTDRK
ncbi:hypothetical protein HPULCUR_003147 [Helicostylum pulchrum]|uniref:Uncharacterized protein n=1 Tax=Helicostylum pulchrum TaxID=562976 RepID=A0ABP9XU45_9FUNG